MKFIKESDKIFFLLSHILQLDGSMFGSDPMLLPSKAQCSEKFSVLILSFWGRRGDTKIFVRVRFEAVNLMACVSVNTFLRPGYQSYDNNMYKMDKWWRSDYHKPSLYLSIYSIILFVDPLFVCSLTFYFGRKMKCYCCSKDLARVQYMA